MGFSNSTANLALPQWVDSDKPTWLGDVNLAFKRVDDASASQEGAISLLQSRMTALEARVTALESAALVRGKVG